MRCQPRDCGERCDIIGVETIVIEAATVTYFAQEVTMIQIEGSGELLNKAISALRTLPAERLASVYAYIEALHDQPVAHDDNNTESIEQLAAAQGVNLATRITDIAFDFWPNADSVDEFLNLRQVWRTDAIRQQAIKLERHTP
jgi:hypothetical protein